MGHEDIFLVCDIGNTAIKIGIAFGRTLERTYTLPTRRDATEDSLGLDLLSILSHCSVTPESISACVVASVCPILNAPLRGAIARYFRCPCLLVPEDVPVPLENHYENPAEVGTDRLVGAWAARQLCAPSSSIIVADFGTALTLDCVQDNAYLGGLIFPGPRTAMAALAAHTAKLPEVALDLPIGELQPCRDTGTSIRHGIIFGYAAVVDGLCQRLASKLPPPARVVATGGFAQHVAPHTKMVNLVSPELLLNGLIGLYLDSREV